MDYEMVDLNIDFNEKRKQMEILDNLPVPILMLSIHGQIHYMNEEGKSLLGESVQIGSPLATYLTRDSIHRFDQFLKSIRLGLPQEKGVFEFSVSETQSFQIEMKGKLSFDQEFVHLTFQKVTEDSDSRFSYKIKYEEIKTVANIGHWELDLSKNEWQQCPKILEFYELDPLNTEITPELFYSLIHPEDRDKVTTAFENSLSERRVYEVDHRILLPSGKIKWIRETCHWIFDTEENPIGAIGTSQDITKQVQLEEKIRNAEINYYNMVENTSSLIWSCDREGRFTYLNPAWERVLGYKKEEMLYRSHSEFQPTEVSERDKQAYEKFNQSGEVVKLGYETIYLTKEGQKRYIEFYPSAIFDQNGFVIGSHGTAIDLTEKKLLDLKLEETYFELGQRQFAIDQHAIVAITNTSGDIIYVNRRFCEISKYSREELLGKNHRIINSGFHPSDFFKELYQTIRKGETWHGEIKNKAKDGTYYWVATTIAPIKNAKGETEKYLSIRTDITQTKEADEKIKLLLEEKELILIEVHHRIKNNMNTIFSLLRMEANVQDNPLQKNILLDASTRVRSMMLLYDKLYRSENTEVVSIKEYFPILITEIISIFPRNSTIRTNIKVDEGLIGAKVLSTIGIIINELITNSMKYSFSDQEQGCISFIARVQGDDLMIEYSDDGNRKETVIENQSRKGFGLNLIQMLVQQLKGTIYIDKTFSTHYTMQFKI